MNRSFTRTSPLILALLLAVACADQMVDSGEGLRPEAAKMDIVSGQDQVAAPGSQLPASLVVRVLNGSGNPVSGQIVNFTVTSGGGSVYAGSALTNKSGVAQEWWTLGASAGKNTLEARAVDGATGAKLVFATFQAEAKVAAARVAVSPAMDSVSTGSKLRLTATVTDANGNVLSDRLVSWTSGNTSVATVASLTANTAEVSGIVVGQATITAVSEGISSPATVKVFSSTPAAAPWAAETFSSYASTADLFASSRCSNGGGRWLCYEDINTAQISLDQTTGYAGSTKSMKYTFPDRTSASGRCADYGMSRAFGLPSPVREVWFEVAAKFSPNFTTSAPTSWACTTGKEYKFILGMVGCTDPSGSCSRFNILNGTHGTVWDAGYPGNEPAFRVTEPLNWDGQWHRYRFHWKVSSSETAKDGVFQLWIDDKLVVNDAAITTRGQNGHPITAINALVLGRNLNQGPAMEQAVWWGAIRAWNQNPGW